MPLYEYRCTKTGDVFEVIQKFSDDPLQECPDCGAPVEKLLSAPAIQFKGEGWYVTDYARKSKDGDKDAAKADSKKSEKGGEKGKSESKSSSKSESKGESKKTASEK